MKFKIGDKVKCVKAAPDYVKGRFFNVNHIGIVIKMCPVMGECVIIKMSNQREYHVYTEYLEHTVKVNQQLLFSFME